MKQIQYIYIYIYKLDYKNHLSLKVAEKSDLVVNTHSRKNNLHIEHLDSTALVQSLD